MEGEDEGASVGGLVGVPDGANDGVFVVGGLVVGSLVGVGVGGLVQL